MTFKGRGLGLGLATFVTEGLICFYLNGFMDSEKHLFGEKKDSEKSETDPRAEGY